MLFDVCFFTLRFALHSIVKCLLKDIKHYNCTFLVNFVLKYAKNFNN